jgi:glycosyltransferase involved in cell wall biosynthesis
MCESLKKPKVSIMVPVYNAKDFIEECIESILSQSHPNIELVLSDDCSTDGTQSTLKKYENNPRIRLFLNPSNLGVTDNCNQALRACTGEYVCFFAGDDIMLPGKIEAQVLLMEDNQQASMSYHKVDVFDSETDKTLYQTESSRRTVYSFFDIIEKGGLPGANSVMARSDCIPATLYDSKFPSVSDWLMFIELSLKGEVLFIDQIYARYRKHQGGVSSKADHLLDETLETLTYIECRFCRHPKIISSCAKGRRKYLLGSLFRALSFNEKVLIDDLVIRFFKNKNYLMSVLVFSYSKSFFSFSTINQFICGLIKRSS